MTFSGVKYIKNILSKLSLETVNDSSNEVLFHKHAVAIKIQVYEENRMGKVVKY